MAKEKAQPQPALQADPVSQLGAIQNIIIGPAMAEFSQRLSEIQESTNAQLEDVNASIQATKDNEIARLSASLLALSKRFDAFEEMVKNELDQLSSQKSNWEDMGNLFIQFGESMKKGKE